LPTDPAWSRGVSRLELDDWSRDGRFLLVARDDSGLWSLPLDGSAAAGVPLTPGMANAQNGAFSPDGTWVAFESQITPAAAASSDAPESASTQIFVQRFSPGPPLGRRQVSTTGGVVPHWNPDGGELFFFTADRSKLLSVAFDADGSRLGRPTFLLDLPYAALRNDFAVADHGRRFLVTMPASPSPVPATVIVNWASSLPK
jgi:hypothetical protein